MSQSYAKSPAAERKFTTREMVLVGMFAAVLAVISQISLPMPTGVPITIQVFGVALVGAVLGSWEPSVFRSLLTSQAESAAL